VHQNSIADFFDEKRDQTLMSLNIKVLRFENKEVFRNLEAVLQEISSSFSK
jgi:very-short-patch-repair endonuclease